MLDMHAARRMSLDKCPIEKQLAQSCQQKRASDCSVSLVRFIDAVRLRCVCLHGCPWRTAEKVDHMAYPRCASMANR